MDILKEIRERHSPLVYVGKEVEKEKLDAVMEAARWSPSCSNNQPWKYVIVHKNDETRKALEDALTKGNSWARDAPYIVVVSARPEDDCILHDVPYYAYDAGMSVMSLSIEAVHQGLAVHQMAGWVKEKVEEAVSMPDGYKPLALFALGYEGDPKKVWDSLHPRIKERLGEPRARKDPKEMFFSGRFTSP